MSTDRTPLVIAHRGVSGLEVENSMAAFRKAVEDECDGIELDIHVTRDGEIAVHHDPSLPDGTRIDGLTHTQLLEYRLADGSVIPTLAEVLQATGTLQLYIEAKSLPPSADAALLALLRGDPLRERLHVHAFDHRIIARLAGQAPQLSLGVLSSSYPVDPVRQVTDAGARTLWQEWELIDEALVERCRQARVEVVAWTVNSADAAGRLTQLGVRGLCGNWPDRIRRGIRNVKGAS